MSEIYFGLGTNLGDKEQNLRVAIQKIEERIGNTVSLSAFYVTEPWGFASGNSFLNAAICTKTDLTPMQVLQEAQEIERLLGRSLKSEGGIYYDRLIDIDLLLYGACILQTDQLVLPHPLMTHRRFVMEPLAEIAPEILHPVLKQTIRDLFIFSFAPQ